MNKSVMDEMFDLEAEIAELESQIESWKEPGFLKPEMVGQLEGVLNDTLKRLDEFVKKNPNFKASLAASNSKTVRDFVSALLALRRALKKLDLES